MELLLELLHRDGRIVARLQEAREGQVLVPAEFLGSRGLPPAMSTKVALTTDFRAWRKAEFDEYAFAFKRPVRDDHTHAAWSFVHQSHRYVVPALAVVRAFAPPAAGLFPNLFRPQSLEDLCLFSGPGQESFVALSTPGGQLGKQAQRCALSILSWLYCFPSARRAWASIYAAATSGGLTLSLPDAAIAATMSYASVPGSYNRYVTSMSLRTIFAHEAPLPFAEGHSQTIEVIKPREK